MIHLFSTSLTIFSVLSNPLLNLSIDIFIEIILNS